ncbi:hypothetical protein ACJMK2_008397, partial [Sinanodonta woodiana]
AAERVYCPVLKGNECPARMEAEISYAISTLEVKYPSPLIDFHLPVFNISH